MTNTPEDCYALLEPVVGPLHENFTAAYHAARKLGYPPVREPGWFRTAAFKRMLADFLPEQLGSFTFARDLATTNPRLLLTDDDNGLQISVRRSTGLRKSMRGRRQVAPVGLFPRSDLSIPRPKVEKAALAWDWPETDDDGELTGPWPLGFLLAKPGRSLDEGDWEFGLPLIQGATLTEYLDAFNPIDEPLTFLDSDDEDGAAAQ
ncbi:hypothetical protein GS538_11715 [Rhodococcus hoagii]|nr:hypothetical protein [Prescottella equi]NKR30638.1 hypothetical protein [Prescottella equi]NKV45464.1 hypothetical protein [Prescottella equi]NKV46348.1 hypothetical protein [Prescottella equi]